MPHLGGVETYTFNLATELVKQGYDVIIVTSNYNNEKNYVKNKISIYKLPVYKLFKNRYPILKKNNDYKSLINKLQDENIDYVLCNTRFYTTSFLAANFAKKNNLPIICIDHSSGHLSVDNKVLDFFGAIYEHFLTFRLKYKIKDYYGVSKRSNEWLNHFKIKASGVFYNSVDKNLYNEYKDKNYRKEFNNKIVLSYVGRVIKEKGLYNLLDAFKLLEKKYQNLVLVIAGDGTSLNDLKEKYKSKNIVYLGGVDHDEVMKLLSQTDIFIHPSMYPEGLPTVILEAGLMKNVVLATDRGGTKEVINKKTGIIIEENVESIVENVEKLLNNEKLMNEYKENIHQEVKEKFTWNINAQKVIEAFERKEKMDNSSVSIFVAAHKKAKFPDDKMYIPIRVGAALNKDDFGYVRDDTKDNISNKNKSFCELTATYWIWKNDKSDIVGLTHYRRYFFKRKKKMDFKNILNKKDIISILKDYDIIVPNRTFIIKHNAKNSWYKTHIAKDYDLVRDIISEKYPDYLESFDKFSRKKTLYICNMFITRKEIFDDYYSWLFDILFELEKRVDISKYDDYNKRLFGFMSERLFNVWLLNHKELKIKRMPVYNTDKRPYNQYLMIN